MLQSKIETPLRVLSAAAGGWRAMPWLGKGKPSATLNPRGAYALIPSHVNIGQRHLCRLSSAHSLYHTLSTHRARACTLAAALDLARRAVRARARGVSCG